MTAGERITDVAAIPEESTFLITVEARESGDRREAILVRADSEVTGWFNYCQHWRDVNLDTGDGATLRNGEIVCARHGATFEADDGECTYGPCEGAVLDELPVRTTDGAVFLDTGEYTFVRVGPVEESDEDDIDLSTESRIGF
ncbi:MAG: Rieske (2Fe-2S) protein [Halolamina sp.]